MIASAVFGGSRPRSTRLAASGTAPAEALTGGYHLAFWIGAALIGVAIGVALVVLRDRKEPVAPAVTEPVTEPAAPPFSIDSVEQSRHTAGRCATVA